MSLEPVRRRMRGVGAQEDLVVFTASRDSACAECGEALPKGRFLRLLKEKPHCLECSDLDHLVYLPAGDTALTRRGRKHSTLSAVVVQFNRSRRRYERTGVLVERTALERAEAECLSDDDVRRLARQRAAVTRERADARFRDDFQAEVLRLYPACPPAEAAAITAHACEKHSGRVGRSAAAKEFEERTVHLAVRAHIRHVHTPYDEHLADGVDRDLAREMIAATLETVARSWRRSAAATL